MKKVFSPCVLCGTLEAIASKSDVHRLLVCAAMSPQCTYIKCNTTSDDIDSTVRCLSDIGAKIEKKDGGFEVVGIPLCEKKSEATLDCGESGSTLRFLLPVCAALGIKTKFILRGRLASRPIDEICDILAINNVSVERNGDYIKINGKLDTDSFAVRADISSQYISGLLFASPLLREECKIKLTTRAESGGYIDMTVRTLSKFGVYVEKTEEEGCVVYKTHGRYTPSKREFKAEGDWSNAAFFLCAGAIGSAPVAVKGLDTQSLQPDKKIIDILRQFGAEVEVQGDKVCVSPSSLYGIELDISECPDLVGVVALTAACALSKTKITGGARLRLKESDRIESVCKMIEALGGEAESMDDGMIIHASGISGGVVDGANDHRIVMSAAVASAAASEDIIIRGALAVNKSYPTFFDDLESIVIV